MYDAGVPAYPYRPCVILFAALCALAALALMAPAAHASGVVTECTDAGLTQALTGGGTVTFSCPGPSPHTIPLVSQMTITAPTHIAGEGVIILDGQYQTRHFEVLQGASLELDGLILTRGGAGNGGSIVNWGTVTMSNGLVISNQASSSGGGIVNAGGTLVIRRSLIAANSAVYSGGGVFNSGTVENPGSGRVSIEDSTIIGNGATATGYFNGAGGGLFNNGIAFITNSTFLSNSASAGGGMATAPDAIVINSTFTGNEWSQVAGMSANMTNTLLGNGPSGNCSGNLTITGSNNLSSDASCAFTGAGNRINTDPRLGPLVYFGVGVPTYSLLPGSPAIDAGTNAGCPATDQRGFARPFGARCDIGAFEWTAPFANAWHVPIFRR
jgi:hypothetical protein